MGAHSSPPALARTGCGPGDGITPSRRHVLRPAQCSMTSPPRACDEEGEEETLLFFFQELLLPELFLGVRV